MKKKISLLLCLLLVVSANACGMGGGGLHTTSEKTSEHPSQEHSQEISEQLSEEVSEAQSEEISEEASEEQSEEVSEEASETQSEEVSEEVSEEQSEEPSEEESVSYTVTFDSAGGTEIESQEVVEGNKVVRPTTPAKKSTQNEEYEFSGWYEGDRLWNFEQDTVSENITLTARWVTKKYTGDLPIRR